MAIVSCVILLAAPGYFHFQPDTGIYVGGARSILEQGSYRFNGQPILIYYPGFSLLLTLPISLFGLDFQVLHLFSAAWCILALWSVRVYFARDNYALAGLLAPALLPFTGVFQEQVLYILSDAPFLAIAFAALLLWRHFGVSHDKASLVACAALVALAPLIRLQGLFLWFAFAFALGLHLFDRQTPLRRASLAGAIGLAVLAPFLLWTARNYLNHTPDTYNMANAFFFGQESLSLYSGDFHKVDWIDARWKYGVYNLLYSVRDLTATIFGTAVSEWPPLETLPLVLGGILLAGLPAWWRRATPMERIYFLVSAGFVIFLALRSGNLYTVPRYWLPILPFVLLTGVFGIQRIYDLLARPATTPWLRALLLTLLLLAVSQGTHNAVTHLEPWADQYYRKSEETRLALVGYVNKETAPGSTIAVTDWGVLPLAIERKTVSVLNDKEMVKSLQRIVNHRATHLVILEGTSAMVDPAKAMVSELPHVFIPRLVLDPDGSVAKGAVYAINLDQAKQELDNRAKK